MSKLIARCSINCTVSDVKYVGSPVNKSEPDSHNGYEGTGHDSIDNELCDHNVLFIAQKSKIKYPENILKKILNLYNLLTCANSRHCLLHDPHGLFHLFKIINSCLKKSLKV